ncbi:ceramidase domain-containing protein [Pelagovum pacificum]|uniref:ceramidase domain-containing protein n=1 Tax=Pelagovum pacificum TaxID=2588711 RepID=UPI002FCD7A75
MSQTIDAYCERLDPGFWAEPVNALTNLFYLAGAIIMLTRSRRDGLPIATILSVLLGLIAIGSFLFHTIATAWASLADTIPIVLFILVYLFAANRDILRMRWPVAALLTAAFIPYVAILVPLLNRVPFLAISNFYWAVPLLLFAYAPIVARRRRATAAGFVAGGALLCLSITLRSLDQPLCDQWPLGTHFLWHTLNSIMLPAMIELYRRHMLEGRHTPR